jgi:hypothetical protein
MLPNFFHTQHLTITLYWTGVKNEGIWDIGIKNC